MTDLTTFDRLKGAALIGTFIGVLITFAMWVSLWENVRQASIEPTSWRNLRCSTQSPWPFAYLDVTAGCRLIYWRATATALSQRGSKMLGAGLSLARIRATRWPP
jgi:hypothetical protein